MILVSTHGGHISVTIDLGPGPPGSTSYPSVISHGLSISGAVKLKTDLKMALDHAEFGHSWASQPPFPTAPLPPDPNTGS